MVLLIPDHLAHTYLAGISDVACQKCDKVYMEQREDVYECPFRGFTVPKVVVEQQRQQADGIRRKKSPTIRGPMPYGTLSKDRRMANHLPSNQADDIELQKDLAAAGVTTSQLGDYIGGNSDRWTKTNDSGFIRKSRQCP